MKLQAYYRTALVLFAVILAVGVFPRTAHALTISPVRLEISGDPGETLTQEIILINESREIETYYTSYANFEAQGESGSPAFVEPTEGLGTWMSIGDAITLNPGQQKKIPFTITIPKSADPGGNFAVIFFGTTPNGKGVSIGAKTGVLILLSVNGDVKEQAGLVEFNLNDKKHFYKQLPVGFYYRFSNQGGDRVKPSGNIIIRSIFGWRVAKVNANPNDGNVLPGTTRKFLPEWAKRDSVVVRADEDTRNESYSFIRAVRSEWHNFAVGVFRARLVAEFGTTNQEIKSKSVYFIVFPWELLLVIIVIAIPVWMILRTLIKRYNRSIIRKAQLRFENRQQL